MNCRVELLSSLPLITPVCIFRKFFIYVHGCSLGYSVVITVKTILKSYFYIFELHNKAKS